MMKILAINGSPRKNWNTATILNSALDGAIAVGAQTELIHLYDLNFKGCLSCFSCKLKDGISYGKCATNDELTPILRKAEEADAIILASPIYLGAVSGAMKSLLERLVFQYLVYDKNHSTLFKRKIKVGLIYTMGAPESMIKDAGYEKSFQTIERFMKYIFGCAESLVVCDTYQFDDYSKYESSAFNLEEKTKRKQEIFPADCKNAFDLGVRLADDLQ